MAASSGRVAMDTGPYTTDVDINMEGKQKNRSQHGARESPGFNMALCPGGVERKWGYDGVVVGGTPIRNADHQYLPSLLWVASNSSKLGEKTSNFPPDGNNNNNNDNLGLTTETDYITPERRSSAGFLGFREAVAEVATPGFWRDSVCEMVIVFFMVFMGIMVTVSFPGNPTSGPVIAIVGGLYVFVLIEGFAHIQLAAMNPLATLVFVTTKRLGFIKGIVYLIFQLAGSVAASKLIYEVTPPEIRPTIRPIGLGPGVSILGGLAVEAVISAGLTFVIAGSLDHDRRKVRMGGLPIGTAIAMGIMVGERYTGGCMNPVIPFGPAAVTGIWKHHWIYWVADFFGGILAIIFYNLFTYQGWPFTPRKTKTTRHDREAKSKMLQDKESQNGDKTVNLRKRQNDSSKV